MSVEDEVVVFERVTMDEAYVETFDKDHKHCRQNYRLHPFSRGGYPTFHSSRTSVAVFGLFRWESCTPLKVLTASLRRTDPKVSQKLLIQDETSSK